MKSGLEGRNNHHRGRGVHGSHQRLNEVRPRRPEQLEDAPVKTASELCVSMKSGLEGRNNKISAGDGYEYLTSQ